MTGTIGPQPHPTLLGFVVELPPCHPGPTDLRLVNDARPIMASLKAFGPLLIVLVTCDGAAAQNLRELAREQAKRNPGEPLLQPASPAHYEPKTIEELTREASVVVQTTLVQTRSYLGSQADRVLTDYSMVTPKFLVGRAPVLTPSRPGMVPALILTTFGGEVVLDGVTVRGTRHEPRADHERSPVPPIPDAIPRRAGWAVRNLQRWDF